MNKPDSEDSQKRLDDLLMRMLSTPPERKPKKEPVAKEEADGEKKKTGE